MEFTDVVPSKPFHTIMVQGVGSITASQKDMRLGILVIDILHEFGVDVTGLTLENLGEHFEAKYTVGEFTKNQIDVTLKPTSNMFRMVPNPSR